MNLSSALSVVPWNILIFFVIFCLAAGALVAYALHEKGYVRAVFSHGKTMFELEAREKNSGRNKKPPIEA